MSIEIRQLVSLAVQHVIDRSVHAFVIPQVAFAAANRPRTILFTPNAALPHMSRCVCLQCLEHLRRAFGTRVYNDVSMISPYIYCIKYPITEMASFLYRRFDRISHFCTEKYLRISKVCLGGRIPSGVRRDNGRTKYVVT